MEKGLKIIFLTIPTSSQKLKQSKDIAGMLKENTGVFPVLSLKGSYQFLMVRSLKKSWW
jgi:hypothetical protein